MSDFFLGEIRVFSFDWAPEYWAKCDGTVMQTQQSAALFSLLGKYYGGNGQTTFALPDLQGRAPLHWGTLTIDGLTYTYNLGQKGGVERVPLGTSQMPPHNHNVNATSKDANVASPSKTLLAAAKPGPKGTQALHPIYGAINKPADLTAMNSGSIGAAGGGASHENIQPFLAVNFCIATAGLYPMRP
jgi:microcystin-dependent protein